jgi:hypothetical protein
MTQLQVIAIPSDRLERIRHDQRDDLGNPVTSRTALGWEPLRCCLRVASVGEAIALISYEPFAHRSPWSEAGPVFVHLAECSGYSTPAELPAALRTGPRVLRTYAADGSLAYEDIMLVADGVDLEPALAELLARPDVARVHVRAHLSQCFTYEVRPAD